MDWLSISLMLLMGLVIVTTFILYQSGVVQNAPYFSWFELHYTIGVMGILSIVLLAHMGVLDKSTVATLFGSLLAYVLGASAGRSNRRAGTADNGSGTTGSTSGDGAPASPASNPPNIPV